MTELDPISPDFNRLSWQRQALARYGDGLSPVDPVDPLGKSHELMTTAVDVTVDKTAVQRVAKVSGFSGCSQRRWPGGYPLLEACAARCLWNGRSARRFRSKSELDGLLWKLSRTLKDMAPHHRTPTVWY